MESSLRSLSDDDLHAAVRRLTARSNVTLADLLAHLGEVEERQPRCLPHCLEVSRVGDQNHETECTRSRQIGDSKERRDEGAILGLLAAGQTDDDILQAYPYLEAADIQAALSYAAWRTQESELPPP